MLRTILYNTRQRLEKEGLPADTYINSRDGSYYWTPEIPVREDAAEFERLYNEAEEETDPERKLALYLDTIHTYSGEFLPAQTRLMIPPTILPVPLARLIFLCKKGDTLLAKVVWCRAPAARFI